MTNLVIGIPTLFAILRGYSEGDQTVMTVEVGGVCGCDDDDSWRNPRLPSNVLQHIISSGKSLPICIANVRHSDDNYRTNWQGFSLKVPFSFLCEVKWRVWVKLTLLQPTTELLPSYPNLQCLQSICVSRCGCLAKDASLCFALFFSQIIKLVIVDNSELKLIEQFTGEFLDILAVSCDSFKSDVNRVIGRQQGRLDHVDNLELVRGLCKEYKVLSITTSAYCLHFPFIIHNNIYAKSFEEYILCRCFFYFVPHFAGF